jgi:hypothetical protein
VSKLRFEVWGDSSPTAVEDVKGWRGTGGGFTVRWGDEARQGHLSHGRWAGNRRCRRGRSRGGRRAVGGGGE